MRKILALIPAAAVLAVSAGIVAADAATTTTPPLRFHGAQYDSPGNDTGSNASLNEEWISLVNSGSSSVQLKGYTIRDAAGHVYTFTTSTVIAAKTGRIWLKTGKGTNSGNYRYWGSTNYIWNNTGDTATLRNAAGKTLDTCTWKSQTGRTWVGC